MKKHVLFHGLLGGVLIALLRMIEYRYLVLEHSIEIYGGLVALIAAQTREMARNQELYRNPFINAAMTRIEPFPVGWGSRCCTRASFVVAMVVVGARVPAPADERGYQRRPSLAPAPGIARSVAFG